MRSFGVLLGSSFVILASGGLAACNAITGAENIVFEEDWGGGGRGGDGAGGAMTTSPTGGMTTTTPTETTTSPPVMIDASGATVTSITLYQGVKAQLMENGAPANNSVPIVAGRDALMRVAVALDGNFNGWDVTARLTIAGVEPPIEYIGPVPTGGFNDASLGGTINFKIPGASIPAGAQFKVEILQPDIASKGPNPNAHYPLDGFAQTGAQSVGQALRIVLVPFRYGADGSNRLPDLSEGQLKGYHDWFYGMYPAPTVEITVRDAVQYNDDVSPNGYGWDQLLGYLGNIRSNDNAPFDVYYYGIFSPASSVNNYCGGGCVAGLGNIGGPGDSYSRAAIGLGFSGDIAFETAVHEIGHTHGRYHSPCGGAQGTDPNYPYSQAKIGVWGYNLLTEKLYNPNSYADVMGYCYPIWVSDFTYKGFFNRMKAVNGASLYVPEEMKNLDYDRARIDADGNLHWMPPVKLELPPQGEPMDVTVDNDAGSFGVTAQYYPYDHLPGGVVLWPQKGSPSSGIKFIWKGIIKSLQK